MKHGALSLSERDRKLYDALVIADEALYQLWRQIPMGDRLFIANLDTLQTKHIQPAIRGLRERAKLLNTGKQTRG